MNVLATVLIAYSAGMLLIHLSSWKLLQKWRRPGGSWVRRWFPPHSVLRIEALYWVLILASWPFWPSAAWKAVLIAFAVIHLGVWLAGEVQASRSGAVAAPPPRAHRYIIAFDLVESVALVAIAWFAAAHGLHAMPSFPGA